MTVEKLVNVLLDITEATTGMLQAEVMIRVEDGYGDHVTYREYPIEEVSFKDLKKVTIKV